MVILDMMFRFDWNIVFSRMFCIIVIDSCIFFREWGVGGVIMLVVCMFIGLFVCLFLLCYVCSFIL